MSVNQPRGQEESPLFMFRVLIEFDSGYNTFVARCLETGSVATADDANIVEDMIKELLLDEVTFAIEKNNLANLYSSPAPLDVWMRFRRAQQRQQGVLPKPMHKAIRAQNEEVPAEIEIARAQ
jgi:hypothetical protein